MVRLWREFDMPTFFKLWVLRSPVQLAPGSTVQVALKSGTVKPVRVGNFIREQRGMWLYATDGDAD
jgi:hypothetical protein